ncbi:MAG TPA: class I SAM-dependent methyltransferase, partial [Bacilli bacterium]
AEKSKQLQRFSSFAAGGSVFWLKQDMRKWELDRQVDAVISFCDCLNYLLEPEDVLATFRQTWQGLRSGGQFLFDVHTPGQLRRYAEAQPFVLNEDDIAYIWTCDFDDERSQIVHELSIFLREQESLGVTKEYFSRIEETHVQRAYDLAWLRGALIKSGFATVECVADFRWSAPTDESQRAFFIATKGD